MHNLDNAKTPEELRAELQAALKSGDNEKAVEITLAMTQTIHDNILAEAKQAASESMTDAAALAARGLKPLTSAEKKYYNALIEGNVNGSAFDGTENILPPTVINRVFEDLKQEHELLRYITFRESTATTEWIVKVGELGLAFWGKLSEEIKELMDDGFETLRMNLFKLSCFIPVSKSMLQLGPEWLDRYVREILAEAISLGLEDAIINGDGVDRPIGIIRDVDDANHPQKTAVALTDLEPVTLGTQIMSPLTKNGKRKVTGVILVVNPSDYWEKIFGATTYLNANGQYVFNILPIPAAFVQSASMPKGFMSAGVAKDYFLGLGFQQGIGYSDEYRYIEDERVYMTKLAANGRPNDNKSFLLFDITALKPALKNAAQSTTP